MCRALLISLFLTTACALAGQALARSAAPLSAEEERSLTPGSKFSECTNCPEMIIIPAGSFMMGSPQVGGPNHEHPQHKVTIAQQFAVGAVRGDLRRVGSSSLMAAATVIGPPI